MPRQTVMKQCKLCSRDIGKDEGYVQFIDGYICMDCYKEAKANA